MVGAMGIIYLEHKRNDRHIRYLAALYPFCLLLERAFQFIFNKIYISFLAALMLLMLEWDILGL